MCKRRCQGTVAEHLYAATNTHQEGMTLCTRVHERMHKRSHKRVHEMYVSLSALQDVWVTGSKHTIVMSEQDTVFMIVYLRLQLSSAVRP